MTLNTNISHRYLIKVWYSGQNFAGSQRQPEKRTVEGELIRTLQELDYLPIDDESSFKTAARTDAGVHASEAAFCFTTTKPFYPTLLDSRVPDDMGIIEWAEVDLNFHPRWEAGKKTYFYVFPLIKEETSELDLNIIREGLKIIEGTHDFRMFSKTDTTKPDKLTEITLDTAMMKLQKNSIIFKFSAQSFLWEQIRRTVSFMIQLGLHESTIDDLQKLLNPSNHNNPQFHRNKAVSPYGLILAEMEFPTVKEFHRDPKFQRRRNGIIQHQLFLTQQTLDSLNLLNLK